MRQPFLSSSLNPADFPLFVDGNPVVSGAQNAFSAGPHTVSETGDPGYGATITGACAENEDDFVDLAVEWAENADKRTAFRAEVADRLMTSPGLDANARARDLERLIEDLWRRACERS